MKANKLKAVLGAVIISTTLLASMTTYAYTDSIICEDEEIIYDESCNDKENVYVPEDCLPEQPNKPEWPNLPIFPEKPNKPEVPNEPELPSEPIVHLPYIKGYEDGTFRAERNVTREEIATMIARLLLNGTEPDTDTSFGDISETRYSNKYVGYLEKMGVVTGYSDGTFRPYEPITRSEMASMIERVERVQGKKATRIAPYVDQYLTRVEAVFALNQVFARDCSDATIPNLFSDLEESYWAYDQILFAAVEHVHEQ